MTFGLILLEQEIDNGLDADGTVDSGTWVATDAKKTLATFS
jgi:hypothetical protein